MEQQTYNIRLDGIQVIEKQMFNAAIPENENFNFDIKAQSLVNHDKKLIIIITQVSIMGLQNSLKLAHFVIAVAFIVQEFDEIIKLDGEHHVLPNELDNLLKSISVSTARGIIFSELRGTYLNNAVLPIVSVATFKPTEGSIIPLGKSKEESK